MSSLSPSYDEEEFEGEDAEDIEEFEGESSSSSPRKPRPPRLVAGRYRIGKKVGSGSYSDVHMAVDKMTGDHVAVKLEWKRAEKTGKLLAEARLYEDLQTDVGIPRVRWWGSKGEYNIMVLDLLGPSLDDIFKKRKVFSIKTVVMLAKQMIDRLEYVHERGLLYRDIKPHNFLMGRGEKGRGRVYLVDFGLAKRYRDASGKHSKLHVKKGRGITGTVRYSSLNVHAGYDASRRDDLLALGYVLVHFLKGGLPWMGLKAAKSKSKKSKHELIRKRKANTSDADLCEDLPTEFGQYFQYCRALEFYDRPDYVKLQSLLDNVMHRSGFANDFGYDWSSKEQGQSCERSSNDSRDSNEPTTATTAQKRKHDR